MAISLERVTLVSIFVESVLYGLFLSLYAISTTILLKGRKNVSINTPMLGVSFAMLILGTIHVGTDLRRVLDGFLNPNLPPAKYLPNVNDASYMVKSAAYIIQTIIGDAFLIYRVFLVWQRNRIVVMPFIFLLLGSTVVGIGTLWSFSRVTPATPVFIVDLQHWIITFFVITLTTNFTCTCLIAGRIFFVHRKTSGHVGGANLAAPLILVIESGAIYSFCLIVLLCLYASGSFAQYIALDATTQVIGVVFSLIIVRIGLGLSSEHNKSGGTPTPISFATNTRNSVLTSIPSAAGFSGSRVSRFLPWLPRGSRMSYGGSTGRTGQRGAGAEIQMHAIPSPPPLEVKVSTAVRTQGSDGYHSWEHGDGRVGPGYYTPYNAIGDSPRNEKLGVESAV